MNNQKCIYQFNNKSSISFHIPGCQFSTDQFQKPVCYGFWKLNETASTDKFTFLAKGCWGKDPNLCKTKLFNSTILFCCCTGEYCNKNLNANQCLSELNRIKNIKFIIDLLSILITLIIIPIIIYFLIKLFNKKKISSTRNQFNQSNKELEKLLINDNQIELLEQRARGRYGDIYRAKLLNQNSNLIAVKIFKKEDYQSFKNELKIYKLKDMKHENILKFITDLESTDIIINQIQYWLITEYKENGSLQEYLFNNLLDDKQTIQISLDISNGLSYLHGYNCSDYRLIAHRDFKSSNILLDGNLRACIADFGLALVFYNHKLETDTLNLNLVGTFRYFSPELLDGAINFCGDSLLKVDIYACALVFWEILSRNSRLHEQNKVKDYKLPYELELGSLPSINELRNHVSFKQRRPIIEQHWQEDKFLNSFCRIIDDSWAPDAETRLTSSCITERLNFLQNYLNELD